MTSRKFLAATGLVALFGSNITIAVAAELFSHGTVRLFNGPGERFQSRGTIAPGVPVTILWCNGAADWCMVQSGARHGWAPIGRIMVQGRNATDNREAPSVSTGGSQASGSNSPATTSASPPASLAGGESGASANLSAGDSESGISVSAGGTSLGVKLQ